MILRQFFNEALAQYSYLLGCPASGESIVIDADRDVEKYLAAAAAEGMRISHVTETHIHADYLSGSRELASRTGAHMFVPGQGGPDWSYSFSNPGGFTLLQDRDSIQVGGFRLEVWHTPGHTPEHISFVLYETEKGPLGAFTGDFIFVGDVGRPDLLEKAAGVSGTMEPGARQLFQSIKQFKTLPDSLVIWPAHGAGSACGKSLGGVPVSTLGYEKLTNWALKLESEDEFVAEVLSGQPEPPKYFAMMKHLNKVGPALLGTEVTVPRSQNVAELDAALLSGAIVLDVRSSLQYMDSHLDGVLHIPIFQGFTNWAGWLIDYQSDVVLIAENAAMAADAAKRMSMIGLDNVKVWFGPEVMKAVGATRGMVSTTSVVAADLDHEVELVDVRGRNEYLSGNVSQSVHIPMGELTERKESLPTGTVCVHCAGGTRSPIAVSVLERLGVKAINVADGYAGLKERKTPVESR